MKLNHFNRIVFISIGVFTLMLSCLSCEKDKLTESSIDISDEMNTDVEANLIVQRIKRFDNQIKEVKNGAYRGNEFMNADSALWNIESLFNVTYSFPDKNYVEKKIHELSFTIDADNDMLSIKEVSVLYDQIVASVKEAYRNDGIMTDPDIVAGSHAKLLAPIDNGGIVLTQPVVGGAVSQMMGGHTVAHGMLHRIDANACGDGVELADLGIVHIVLCEEIGVRPDMAVVDDAAVTQLHKGAEGGVIDNAGGVDQGFVFS